MQRTLALARAVLASAVLASFAIAGEARAQARVEVGILTCTARGSTGHIVTSTKYLRCRFQRPGRDEFYRGSISKFGIDLGSTGNDGHRPGRAGANREPAAALAQRCLRRARRCLTRLLPGRAA